MTSSSSKPPDRTGHEAPDGGNALERQIAAERQRQAIERNARWRLWAALEKPDPALPLLVGHDNIDSLTQAEYGSKTWTPGQAVRDVLQNHLDAETDQYIQRLLGAVLDVGRLDTSTWVDADIQRFEQFSFALLRYVKTAQDTSTSMRSVWADAIGSAAKGLPLRVPLRRGACDLDALDRLVERIPPERPPAVRFAVRDRRTPDAQLAWVTAEVLCAAPYNEVIKDGEPSGGYRYELVGFEVHDHGTGFDAKLTELYKSSKTGAPHLRGRFGEGIKMNFAHFVSNGASVASRSCYSYEESGRTSRKIWRRMPYIGQGGRVFLRSVQADVPPDLDVPSGSSTVVVFEKAEARTAQQWRSELDPRTGGIGRNCLEFSNQHFVYPVPVLVKSDGSASLASVGVCTDGSDALQYVQGLRIEGADDDWRKRLFSYNFLDRSLLLGRDRRGLQNEAGSQIYRFWQLVDSPELQRRCLEAYFGASSEVEWIEGNTIKALMMDHEFHEEDTEPAQRALFAVLPEVLGLEEGRKYVVLSSQEMNDPMLRDVRQSLERAGYTLHVVPPAAARLTYTKFSRDSGGRYMVRTLQEARGEVGGGVALRLQEHSPDVQRATPAVERAVDATRRLLIACGETPPEFDVDFRDVFDPATDPPLTTEFHEDAQRAIVVVRPALLVGVEGPAAAYWERRIQVELLSTLWCSEPFEHPMDVYKASQHHAHRLLQAAIPDDAFDLAAVPTDFGHRITGESARGALESLYGSEQQLHKQMGEWEIYDIATAENITPELLTKALEGSTSLSQTYQTYNVWNRCIVRGDTLFTPKSSMVGQPISMQETPLDSTPVVGNSSHGPIHKTDSRLVCPIRPPLAEGDVVTIGGTNKFVLLEGRFIEIASGEFRTSSVNRYTYAKPLQTGCFAVKYYKDHTKNLEALRTFIDSVTIERASVGVEPQMASASGVLPTNITVDYGADQWNKPERVFQDIVQNHIDASPENSVRLDYEVQRGAARLWVTGAQMKPKDTIVGLRIRDNGSGYSPDNLGTMGFSSKKSPIFSGKYGEGQKMIAAAAVRNGLELRYSSRSRHAGVLRRWHAHAASSTERIVQSGKAATTQRVMFGLSSAPLAEDSDGYVSETVIRVPDGMPTDEVSRWFSVVDPRNKDDAGRGGLSRYVRQLRTRETRGNEIDLGGVRLLPDEPGAIYENGLLITRNPQKYAFGYDVPSVTKTRERNAVDDVKLIDYIRYGLMHCHDERAIRLTLEKLRSVYDGADKSQMYLLGSLADIDLSKLFQFSSGGIPSFPLWRKVCREVFPGLLLHCEESERRQMGMMLGQIKFHHDRNQPDREEAAKRDLLRRMHVLANIGHLSSDQLITMPEHLYDGFAKVMPTAREYSETLISTEVQASPETIRALQRVVVSSARTLYDVFSGIAQSDIERLAGMLTSAGRPTSPAQASEQLRAMQESLSFWTDERKVQSHLRSVFVSPASAGYEGLAEPRSIGINEQLLQPGNAERLVGVVRHELLHSITGLHDYTPEFIMFFLEVAERDVRRRGQA